MIFVCFTSFSTKFCAWKSFYALQLDGDIYFFILYIYQLFMDLHGQIPIVYFYFILSVCLSLSVFMCVWLVFVDLMVCVSFKTEG